MGQHLTIPVIATERMETKVLYLDGHALHVDRCDVSAISERLGYGPTSGTDYIRFSARFGAGDASITLTPAQLIAAVNATLTDGERAHIATTPVDGLVTDTTAPRYRLTDCEACAEVESESVAGVQQCACGNWMCATHTRIWRGALGDIEMCPSCYHMAEHGPTETAR